MSTNWKARELEILQLLAEGLTNGEIGTRLHLAPDTVRWYNKHIFEKLAVNNRLHAVQRATELGLLTSSGGHPPPTRPPVQYVANGDVHLAYQVLGAGPNDLIFIHGFLSHLELAWENEEFTQFFEQLSRHLRVILFDKRGMGLSDRVQGAPSIEDTIEDARCVLKATGSQRAFILGTSEGGAAAVLLAATYPEQVRGLILYAATAKVVQANGDPTWAATEAGFNNMITQMQKTWGGPWNTERFAPARAHLEDFRQWWAMILRAASSPSSVKAVLDIIRQIDIRPLLPQVRTRSLVIHKTNDGIVNVAAGRYLAQHLPNATWLELPGADHIYFVESAALVSAILQFCQAPAQSESVTESWIAIILSVTTDPDSQTDLIHATLTATQPRRLVLHPDGFTALFDSATRAIQCALQLRQAIQPNLKISLHVGECNVTTGQPTEPVRQIARVAAELSTPGEVVVTGTLRDILAGSSFEFAERINSSESHLPQGLGLYTLI